MGIYIFNRDVLLKLLDNTLTDFGKHIIPGAIETHRVFSYVFQGYWEDIGTIRAFFEANLDITSELPRFNFFDMTAPIFSRPRWLPASKINGAQIDHAIISDGCIISHAAIHQSIIGIRSIVSPGGHLNRTIMLGSDYYESAESIAEHEAAGQPRIGIGTNTRIDNAIIDKNARIGNNVIITPKGKAGERGPPAVFHPRRHRDHSEERHRAARDGDLGRLPKEISGQRRLVGGVPLCLAKAAKEAKERQEFFNGFSVSLRFLRGLRETIFCLCGGRARRLHRASGNRVPPLIFVFVLLILFVLKQRIRIGKRIRLGVMASLHGGITG